MLAHWLYTQFKATNPHVPSEKIAVINTTVSSRILAIFAEKERLHYEETLTGFKWIGSKALELQQKGYHILFCYEEAIGFLVGETTLDKDGISAGAVFAEMASELYSRNISKKVQIIKDHLYELYQKYSFVVTKNSYFFCYDPQQMFAIFKKLKNDHKYQEFCGKFKIKDVRDLNGNGYDSRCPDKKTCSSY